MQPGINMALSGYLAKERPTKVPKHLWDDAWRKAFHPPIELWLCGTLCIQVYDWKHGAKRLTMHRPYRNAKGDWEDRITWDELQAAKADIGLGDRWAVEAFPPDAELVNVANMRHLFVLEEAPEWGWTRKS